MIAKPTSTATMEAAVVLEALFLLLFAGDGPVDSAEGKPPAKIR